MNEKGFSGPIFPDQSAEGCLVLKSDQEGLLLLLPKSILDLVNNRYIQDGWMQLASTFLALGVFQSLEDGLGVTHFLERASKLGPDKKRLEVTLGRTS